MIEMRPSRAAEIPAQKRLWKLAFGDDDAFIEYFYERCAGPEDMLVLLEDGALRSMLALLPMEMVLPDGGHASSAYIYALATDPEARGRGFGRSILQYADFCLRERGTKSVTVVPAEVGLFKFFSTVGFLECFATRKLELLRGDVGPVREGDGLEPVGAAEYDAAREGLLTGTFHAAYGSRLTSFQEGVSRKSGAGLYRVRAGGHEGCTAAEYTDRHSLTLKELLIDPTAQADAQAAVKAALPAERYFLRTPGLWDGLKGSCSRPFAMIKWFDWTLCQRWYEERSGYFGLGFD